MSRQTKKKKKLIKAISKASFDYLLEVNSLGNECAYTDRMVEEIISLSKELEKTHNEFFNKKTGGIYEH